MGNSKFAEELTISVFLSASRRIKSYKPEILFSDWLILNTIHNALEQLKDNDKKKKKWKKKDAEDTIRELQIDPFDREILNLDKFERIAIVLNKIENIPIKHVAKYIEQPDEKETQKIIDGAIENLVKSVEDVNSPKDVIDSINKLPREIKFDKRTTEKILTDIYEGAEKEERDKEDAKVKKDKKIVRKKEPQVKRKKTEEKLPGGKMSKKNILIGAGILAAIVVCYLVYTSGSRDWKVKVLSGSVKIGVEVTSSSGIMIAGDALETDPNSTAEITIPEIGKIEVYPSTIISKMGDENTANLKIGSIKVDFNSAKSGFKILLPVGYIKDYYLANSYFVEINQEGDAVISVKQGWLSTIYRNVEMIIATDYSVQYKSSSGFGIPYHNSASVELINLLGEVAFNNNETSINSILNSVTKTDALTLWNLMQRVKTSSKQSIYDKLYELVPHPDEISSSDILRLDKEKLLLWLEEIEWQM